MSQDKAELEFMRKILIWFITRFNRCEKRMRQTHGGHGLLEKACLSAFRLTICIMWLASELTSTALQPHSDCCVITVCLFFHLMYDRLLFFQYKMPSAVMCHTSELVNLVNLNSSGSSLEPLVLMYEWTNTYSRVLRNKKCVIVYR